jgi:excisionase family DNA binding protein
MQRKFRLNDDTWNAFLNKTNAPSDTLRDLVNNYLDNGFPLNQVIGVEEAAIILGLSPGTIKNKCAAGEIAAKKIGKTWVIDKSKLS